MAAGDGGRQRGRARQPAANAWRRVAWARGTATAAWIRGHRRAVFVRASGAAARCGPCVAGRAAASGAIVTQ